MKDSEGMKDEGDPFHPSSFILHPFECLHPYLSMATEDLIREGLCRPVPAIAYSVSEQLAALHPDRALVEGDEAEFQPRRYASAGFCEARLKGGVHSRIETSWQGRGKSLYRQPTNAWLEVSWEGHSLDVLLMSWPQGYCDTHNYWILAESREVAERFFYAVCDWCSEVHGEVLVFSGGHWQKDRELFEGIQGTTFENLILAGSLKQEIQDDIRSFFESRTTYEAYGVPWKRGILFLGPPGNGKTHAVKALINHLEQPCLYVKSFKSQYATDHDNIRSVFKRARESTPCILVFEDLDSLLDGGNRSYFLNELDGFAANTGIVTLATTNHPERLDPSILERPSRFDRKYHFDLPGPEERVAYLALWNERLQEEMRLPEPVLEQVVQVTEGFSFAYLKELVLSSMMRWISAPEPGGMTAAMAAQAATLRTQMSSMNEEPPREEEEDAPWRGMRRFYTRSMRRKQDD
jgi:DNA polymerase III delta prime subunit